MAGTSLADPFNTRIDVIVSSGSIFFITPPVAFGGVSCPLHHRHTRCLSTLNPALAHIAWDNW